MKTTKQVEGFAGKLAKMFIESKLTLLIAVASLLLGLMAIWLTPKEEEPQISVPMIDIQTAVPGLNAHEIEKNVTEVIERGVWGLDGVEYVYSASMDHGSLVTVRFKVGEPMEPSLVKFHHKLMSLRGELPQNTMPSVVKSFSIDDVPFLVLTFSSKTLDDYKLRTLVAPLARELSSTPELSRVELLGGLKRIVSVQIDSQKIKNFGVSVGAVAKALMDNGYFIPTSKNWSTDEVLDIEIGSRLKTISDVENISIGASGGRIVKMKDVTKITDGAESRTKVSTLLQKDKSKIVLEEQAVSIAFAKRKGTNVVSLARNLIDRAEVFSKKLPPDIQMTIVRDYGSTAHDKSKELIEHLLLATFSVAILIAIIMGVRASVVVAIAIPVTLALTLAIYYFMGYTLNRVTLFALIFSIGILVDDAIVVVENIERHLNLNKKLGILKSTLNAVSEVGNPTILATIAVIAAILPMAFVRGLMGPYMLPIPVGASVAMIFSLLVAFIVTPWAAVKILKVHHHNEVHSESTQTHHSSKLDQLYEKIMNWFFHKKLHSIYFIGFSFLLLFLSTGLIFTKSVKVKMLPFDNKEEFQVLLDYPTSTPLDVNHSLTKKLARELLKDSHVEKVQIFTGEPAPFSFSGMVKHTFMRRQDYQSDLQIVLTNKHLRSLSSHDVIQSLRNVINEFSIEHKVISKVLEIPPGPPVMATIVAEVYGPNESERQKGASEIESIFKENSSLVDIDSTLRLGRSKLVIPFDYSKGSQLGVSAKDFSQQAAIIFMETPLALLEDTSSPEEVNVVLSFDHNKRSSQKPLENVYAPSYQAGIVDLESLSKESTLRKNRILNRKNLKPVEYVMAEMTGEEEAPVYGIMDLTPKIKYPLHTAEVPWDTQNITVKWDGEWFITYEVFRDMGFAFAVVLILIYVLVVGWFKSFTVPLVIMAPIPISLIGILPGHAFFNSYFTATSMIGFIAGAGIIVRNSIILVDFIEHQIGQGLSLKEAVVSAGVLRFRPMLLTAAAVVVGSSVMLFDPIFQGLAISLIFGEVAATVLSRFAVPILYYWLVGKSREKEILSSLHLDNESHLEEEVYEN